MAVALDATGTVLTSGSGTGTSTNYTGITVGSGSNRALIVYVALTVGGSAPVLHWDSAGTNQLMTLLGTGVADGTSAHYYLFGLVAPTSGAKNLLVSWTGTVQSLVDAVSFTGVNQTGGTTSFPHYNSATGTGTTATVVITSATGNFVVGIFGDNFDGVGTTGQTQLYSDNTGISSSGNYSAGAASVSLTSVISASSSAWGAAGCDILAAAAVSVAVVGRTSPFLFSPRRGPTRGLSPTQAFPPVVFNRQTGITTPALFAPGRGPTRGLLSTQAFPPGPGPPQTGIITPRLFAPSLGPTRGLQLTQAFPTAIVTTASLFGLSIAMAKAVDAMTGKASLLTVTIAEAKAVDAMTGRAAMSSQSIAEATGRMAAGVFALAMSSRSIAEAKGAVSLTGKVLLAAVGEAMAMARETLSVVTSLVSISGASAAMAKGYAAISGAASLATRSVAQAKGADALTSVLALATRALAASAGRIAAGSFAAAITARSMALANGVVTASAKAALFSVGEAMAMARTGITTIASQVALSAFSSAQATSMTTFSAGSLALTPAHFLPFHVTVGSLRSS
jgi:hypothetical protein